MQHFDGVRLSIIDEASLDSQGILTGVAKTAKLSNLPDISLQLFLQVAAAGSLGLAKSQLPLELRSQLLEALLPLELANLVVLERDNKGKPTYLVLTWLGQEALEAARPKKKLPMAAQRRRSIRAQS